MKLPKFTFLNEHDRGRLSEGRNYGLGTAFCKRNDSQLVATHAITACKDFENDVIYSEVTGRNFSVYGLHTKKQNLFSDGYGYLVFSILKQNRSTDEYIGYKEDRAALNGNYKNIQKFINYFDEQFGANKTIIKKLKNNLFLAVLDAKFWCRYSYLISFYILMLRLGLKYKEGNPINYLDNNKCGDDYYTWNSIREKTKRMLNKEFPNQDLFNLSNPHRYGIVYFSFPEKPIEPQKPVEINSLWVGVNA